jgi:hypothetical protein
MRLLRAALMALALPLAACLGEGTSGSGFGLLGASGAGQTTQLLRKTELFQGRVVVAGPEGYCIDRQSLRRNSDGAFVLLASCESLSGQTGGAVAPAVLTVSVLPRQASATSPDAQELAALATGARILQSADEDGLSYVQLSAGGDSLMPQGDPRHWRGGMLVNGHLVGLAVYGAEGSAAAGVMGRSLLRGLARTILSLSPT